MLRLSYNHHSPIRHLLRSHHAGYAVFAKVVNGMDVVDQIVNSQTTTKQGMQNVPIDPVLIKSAKRID